MWEQARARLENGRVWCAEGPAPEDGEADAALWLARTMLGS